MGLAVAHLLIPLDWETGAVPHDPPLLMYGRGVILSCCDKRRQKEPLLRFNRELFFKRGVWGERES